MKAILPIDNSSYNLIEKELKSENKSDFSTIKLHLKVSTYGSGCH